MLYLDVWIHIYVDLDSFPRILCALFLRVGHVYLLGLRRTGCEADVPVKNQWTTCEIHTLYDNPLNKCFTCKRNVLSNGWWPGGAGGLGAGARVLFGSTRIHWVSNAPMGVFGLYGSTRSLSTLPVGGGVISSAWIICSLGRSLWAVVTCTSRSIIGVL